ncbi:MAG: ABC transporter ATP-binding protein [Nostoc sp.]|uniref:ABC transporter ATP-binding protein n=1 Tax=Nostoc sp. TaxID=1180 RepID=UPI002FF61D6B
MTSTSPNILPLLAPQKGKLILSCIASIMAIAMGLVPFILVYLITISLFNPPIDPAYIWKLVIVSFVVIVSKWIFLAISGFLSHTAAYNILYDIRVKLAEKFGTLPLGYFNYNSSGVLKKVMNEDVEYLELFIAHGIPEIVGTVATLIFTTAYLFTVDWRMTLASLIGILLAILAQILMFRDIQPLLKGYYEAMNQMNETIIEYVQGMAVIKAFTQTTESFTQYQKSVINYQNYEEKWALQTLLPWTLFVVSLSANIIVILPVGGWLLLNNSLSIPTLILFLLLGLGICTPLFRFLQSAEIMVQTQEGVKRLQEIMNEPPILESDQAINPSDLTIKFKNVYFSYQEKEVLHGISFTIPANSITALVGPSGSGKTTIARLITRFWDVTQGEICLGGINIKDLKTEVLMSKIAFVFQEVLLFNDTIQENVRMGNPNASEQDVIAAANFANCHEFIEALPNNYQTVVGERGVKLSGGQKQRISIARAILKDAPIIILDEATAFIDPENEAQIQQAISTLIKQKTLLIIAHRLSTIAEADQIIVVDEGQIVGQGKHEELLTQNDLYRKMWDAHVAAREWSFDIKI